MREEESKSKALEREGKDERKKERKKKKMIAFGRKEGKEGVASACFRINIPNEKAGEPSLCVALGRTGIIHCPPG